VVRNGKRGATLYDPSRNLQSLYDQGEPMDKIDKGSALIGKIFSLITMSPSFFGCDRIWFGTYFYGFGGGGISYYSPRRILHGKDSRPMTAEPKSQFHGFGWRFGLGGVGKGLSLLDKKTEGWKRFYSMEDGLSGNFVNSLLSNLTPYGRARTGDQSF